MASLQSNQRALDCIPGVGPSLGAAMVASLADPKVFRLRSLFLGLDRAGAQAAFERGRDRVGSISKQSVCYLRGMFVAGALAVIRYAKISGAKHRPWLAALLARRPAEVTAIAFANKLARMALGNDGYGQRYNYSASLRP